MQLEPSAAPSPVGVKTSVWLLVSRQLPGVLGERRGRLEPSTAETGLENVRWICVAGEMCVPAAGRLTITGAARGREPAHLRGRADGLPGPRRDGDLGGAGLGLGAQRDRGLGRAQRMDGRVPLLP